MEPIPEEILDLLEEMSRRLRAKFVGVTALIIGDELLAQLEQVVREHRPIPYHYQGGRRYRGDVCIDTDPPS